MFIRRLVKSADSVRVRSIPHQFAAIDVETTGLDPKNDRVLEVAVYIIDIKGNEVYRWHTLINPESTKIGPVAIHGIQKEWVAEAPKFSEVAGNIGTLLTGRVALAHNGKFDFDFVKAEFRRCGLSVRSDLKWFDTMAAANQLGLPRRLEDLANVLGVPYYAHSALDDAIATANVFLSLAEQVGYQYVAQHQPVTVGVFPDLPFSDHSLHRAAAVERLAAPRNILHGYVPPHSTTNAVSSFQESEGLVAYAALLEEALSDHYLSYEERNELRALASEWALDPDEILEVHERFFGEVCSAFLSDRKLTKSEREHLELLGECLGLSPESQKRLLTEQRAQGRLEIEANRADAVGKSVHFTGSGTYNMSIREALCAKYGMKFLRRFDPSCDAVVIGHQNPNQQTINEASQLGIPILREDFFWRSLGERP
jgi:DNA polymerase-3 subunit epsilon